MKQMLIYTAIMLLGLNSCETRPHEVDVNNNPIQGMWRLHIMEVKDSLNQWQEWRQGMAGYLLYDNNNHVALHLFSRGYENYEPHFPNFTDSIPLLALKHLTNNYNYMGTYKLDTLQQIVTHKRLSHSNPRDWGLEVQRQYELNGDTLVMRPVESENASLRLKWIKVR